MGLPPRPGAIDQRLRTQVWPRVPGRRLGDLARHGTGARWRWRWAGAGALSYDLFDAGAQTFRAFRYAQRIFRFSGERRERYVSVSMPVPSGGMAA